MQKRVPFTALCIVLSCVYFYFISVFLVALSVAFFPFSQLFNRFNGARERLCNK